MLTFEQFRNIVHQIDSWDDGITYNRFLILKSVVDETGVSIEGADPIELIELVHALMRDYDCSSESDNDRALLAYQLLDQWIEKYRHKNVKAA